ncbi:MAG: hypothetical protein MK213_01305, partial [Planctomycetes bacterium]|nr:hypothetical protein [Planctomycetota bacterium]
MDSSSIVLLNARDPEEVRVVRMVGDKLEDLRWIRGGQSTMVGNLYAAVVTKIEPGLDAAFLDFGEGRAGFLHVGNVLDKSDPKTGEEAESSAGERRIEDLLAEGQKLVVQVQRDPIRNKGATLTNLVSMAGKRLVWMPSMRRPGVSRRIEDEEER